MGTLIRRSDARGLEAWVGLAVLLGGGFALCLAALSPPAPRTAESPANAFSEPRARALVAHLSETIGVRLNGTAPHRRAADHLAAELRAIPGLEVEAQEVGGTHVFATVQLPPFVYRTRNVVARLPGRSPAAVLLNAHYDTQLDSVGAADDAAGVAAIVETLRVLAREAPFDNTIVVNLNGAEELGLLGAAGFLQHRWAKDVRAYVYLEALPGGLTGLFGAGPGHAWLAKTYARAVARPFGAVVGQDLVRAGLLPHNGDFTPFHEAGLSGLDMAMTGDGWAYHTMLDRSERLAPGSLQHLGDSVLAVTRALARTPLPGPGQDRGGDAVYYDFLGVAMAVYGQTAARALALAALAGAAAVIAWALRRRAFTWQSALAALGWTMLAIVAGIAAATGTAALVAKGFGRPLGWFSAPALLLPAFAAPAAAGSLAVHALWRRRAMAARDPLAQVQLALVGALLFFAVLLTLATLKGVGAGYIPLFHVFGASLALFVTIRAPRTRPALLLACFLPAVILTLEISTGFLTYFVPITGMMGLGASDLLIAALVASVLTFSAAAAIAVLHVSGGLARSALVLTAVAAVGVVLVATRFPYTQDRPKRLTLSHIADGDASALRLRAHDGVGWPAVLAALPGPPRAPGERLPGADRFTHELPAPAPPMPAPRIEVRASQPTPDGGRRVTVHIHGTSPLLRLAVPKGALRGWSLAPSLGATLTVSGRHVAQFYDLEPAGRSVTLDIRGAAPVEIELRGTDGARPAGPEVHTLLRALPPWVTTSVYAVRITRLRI